MPVETNDGEYPIKFTLPGQKFTRKFLSNEEVRDWARAQMDGWTLLLDQDLREYFPDPHNILGLLKVVTSNVFNGALRADGGEEILSAVERSGVLVLEGKQAQLAKKILAERPALFPGAAIALIAASGNWEQSTIAQFGDRISWHALLSGLGAILTVADDTRSATAERRILDDLIERTQGAVHEGEALRAQFSELFQASKTRFTVEQAERELRGEAAENHFRSALQSCLDESAGRIADLEQQVRDRLILEAPTVYWTNKAKSHRTTAAIFGGVFLLALGGGVYWLTHHGVTLVGDAYKEIVGNRENPGLLALVPLAFITLPTLAFAWLLRHVSRIIVQNLSLQADAQLRGTIANTYSALVSEHSGTTPELAIALNALFRPIDGTGHTEISPPNIKDILEMGKS